MKLITLLHRKSPIINEWGRTVLPSKVEELVTRLEKLASSGVLEPVHVSTISNRIKDAVAGVDAEKAQKYKKLNFKNGVQVTKNWETGTIQLKSNKGNIKPKTFKYNWTRNRYINPNTHQEMHDSLNDIVKQFAAGKFN